jgi:phosphate acyltransferase
MLAAEAHSMSSHDPTLVIDAYGGYDAPRAVVAAAAARSLEGKAHIVLVGDGPLLSREVARHSYDPMRLRIIAAGAPQPRVTGDHLALTEAARSSLPLAFAMLRDGEADALITCSPPRLVTLLAAEQLRPLVPTWRRPQDGENAAAVPSALASVVPTMPRSGHEDPFALLLDVGGGSGASADALCAFAVLGASYARVVSGIRQPSVALLSTGLDPSDGPAAVVEANRRLRADRSLRFVGNVRAIDIPRGLADVVVVEGFAGHAVRGLLEGLTDLTVEAARYAWKTKTTWRIGLRLLSQGVGMLRRVSEFRQYGGAPLLGYEKLVLLADASSAEAAISNALKLAGKCVRHDLQGATAQQLAQSTTWRSQPIVAAEVDFD